MLCMWLDIYASLSSPMVSETNPTHVGCSVRSLRPDPETKVPPPPNIFEEVPEQPVAQRVRRVVAQKCMQKLRAMQRHDAV